MKTSLLLILLQLASAGNDAYWTNHNVQSSFASHHYKNYENNPIARPFVKSTTGCVVYFSASAATHIAAAHLLRKHHHDRIADFVLVEGIVDHGVSGGYSAAHSR